MQELFDYVASPLRSLIENEEIGQEIEELYLGALAWIVPVIAFCFWIWAVVQLLGACLCLAGGGRK